MSSDPLDLPDFLKRPVVQMGEDGRLHTEEIFSVNETYGGITREQLLVKVAKRLHMKMEKAGAIEPYEYTCGPIPGLGFSMRAEEV